MKFLSKAHIPLFSFFLLALWLILFSYSDTEKQHKEQKLMPRWESSLVQRIELPAEELILFQDNEQRYPQHSWLIRDKEDTIWPVDQEAIQYLLQLPGLLTDHPVFRSSPSLSEGPFFDPSREASEIIWKNRQGHRLFSLKPGLEDSRKGFFYQTESSRIYRSDFRMPSAEFRYLMNLQPLKTIQASELILFRQQTPLEGSVASSFQYSLVLTGDQWIIAGREWTPDSREITLFLTQLPALQAVSLLHEDHFSPGEPRFSWRLENSRGTSWDVTVFDSLRLGERELWPLKLKNEPWYYLFEQEELKKIARPLESLLNS